MTWFRLKGDARLGRCASERCGGQPTWRLEADGVGSNYCSGCKENIEKSESNLVSEVPKFEYTEKEMHRIILIACEQTFKLAERGHNFDYIRERIIDAFVSVTEFTPSHTS